MWGVATHRPELLNARVLRIESVKVHFEHIGVLNGFLPPPYPQVVWSLLRNLADDTTQDHF